LTKKEYDKKRYNKIKEERLKNGIDHLCMRCEERYANVLNNQLYWCFNCLEKYEKEYKCKIKVEVIDNRKRLFSLPFNKYKNDIIGTKTIEGYFYDFINSLENRGVIDDLAKSKILELSNLDKKEKVIMKLINDINIFLDYEESSDDKLVDFPYKKYLKLLGGKIG